ncbi:MAG TPA: hypothetical protein VJQ58_01455 [Burkholderiales bacterium]|nr:hypothetical protein [Burkholderiales bacterium]
MLLEPLEALPLGEELEELGGVAVEPPAPLEELLLDGELGVVDEEPDDELDGELGVVAEPLAEPEVEPAPGVVRVAERSPALSPQAVRRVAPSAIETATARAESLISGPPWVGVRLRQQDSGPYR